MESIDRRSFIASAAVAAGAAMAATAPAMADEIAWDDAADILIVGAGCAGLAAACTAAFEDLGSTINLEAAPEWLCGGNSSATVGVLFCPNNVEGALTYQAALDGPYNKFMDKEIARVWAEDIIQNKAWLEDNFDCVYNPNIGITGTMGEFPTLPGAEECPTYRIAEGSTWRAMKEGFDELELPIYYDARAIQLITDEAGNVIGVECEDGRKFKGNKGVLLATGGFEFGEDMMRCYMPAGYPDVLGMGSWYNRGDGIRMSMALGANLKHMNNVSGASIGVRIVPDDFEVAARTWFSWKTKGYIYVDEHGHRFMDENVRRMHGKMYDHGAWVETCMPEIVWAIFTQEEFDQGNIFLQNNFCCEHGVDCFHCNEDAMNAGSMFKAETVAELAEITGLPEAELQRTLDRYNGFAANNSDEDFNRGKQCNMTGEPMGGPASEDDVEGRAAFDLVPVEAPYYCIRAYGTILNTQGGPVRSVDCEIMDVWGNPIPRLYSAGEMGCEYDYIYNAGGNISEAISSGRRAARIISALEAL